MTSGYLTVSRASLPVSDYHFELVLRPVSGKKDSEEHMREIAREEFSRLQGAANPTETKTVTTQDKTQEGVKNECQEGILQRLSRCYKCQDEFFSGSNRVLGFAEMRGNHLGLRHPHPPCYPPFESYSCYMKLWCAETRRSNASKSVQIADG